jgi:hypothetical protein
METFTKFVGIVVIAIIVAFGFSVLFAFPVKWLWNGTLPELFSFKEIDLWMAWKILFLSSLLFRSAGLSSSKD